MNSVVRDGEDMSEQSGPGLVSMSLLSADNDEDTKLVRFKFSEAEGEERYTETLIKLKIYKHDYSVVSIGPCDLWYEGQVRGYSSITVELETGYDYIYDVRVFGKVRNRFRRVEKKIGLVYNMDLFMETDDPEELEETESDNEMSPVPSFRTARELVWPTITPAPQRSQEQTTTTATPGESVIVIPDSPRPETPDHLNLQIPSPITPPRVIPAPPPPQRSQTESYQGIGTQPAIIQNEATQDATSWVDYCAHSCNQFLSHLRIHRNSHINKLSQAIVGFQANARYIDDIKYSTVHKKMYTITRPISMPGGWSVGRS